MSALLTFLTFAVSLMQPVSAAMPRYEEHLLPENSVYTDIKSRVGDKFFSVYADYEENVARVLFDAYHHDVVGRVFVLPSFEPEYAIALTLSDENYGVLHLKSSAQLWHFESLEMLRAGAYRRREDTDGSELAADIKDLESRLPASRQEVVVEHCERMLSKKVGTKLYSLWSEMLFRTRYPDLRPASPKAKPVPLGLAIDGTAYHFSFEYPRFTLAGKILSPGEDSVTGQFVAIAEMMKDACHAEDNEHILADMEQRIDALTATLSETNY